MERQLKEPHRQDPYRSSRKPAKNPQCPSCRAISVNGRWYVEDEGVARLVRSKLQRTKTAIVRQKPLARLAFELCPACRQLRERYAQGVVELHGEQWKQSADEILQTIDNSETIARKRNDQERILWTRSFRGVTKVYVTLPELARRIGRSLQRSFKGKAEYHRSTEEPYLRVIWRLEPEPRRESAAQRIRRKSRNWRARGRRSDSR
jgi:NMD protein affecting ribosome stability and mRNA decay